MIVRAFFSYSTMKFTYKSDVQPLNNLIRGKVTPSQKGCAMCTQVLCIFVTLLVAALPDLTSFSLSFH